VNDGAAVVVALGKRNPLVAVVDDVCDGPDVTELPVEPPIRIPPVLDAPPPEPVTVPPIVPVQAAPIGQQATFPP
jgi:hypothetical protein